MDLKKPDLGNALEKVEELANFTKEPVKTLETKFGIDLSDEQINKLVDAIKAKLNLDKAGDLLGGIGKLFDKR